MLMMFEDDEVLPRRPHEQREEQKKRCLQDCLPNRKEVHGDT